MENGDIMSNDADLNVSFEEITIRPKSRRLKIHNITYNTNKKAPPADLDKLFMFSADIYAIGLQELGAGNWVIALDNALAEESVVRIKTRRMQGIMLVVYIQRYLLDYITRIESESTKTGLGGMWGNKGGVSVRFDILGVSVIIVNCHLAAHDNQMMQRVQDVNDIIDSQKFRDENVNNILDHDYVFWMGDLNFRVAMTYDHALDLAKTNDAKALMKRDQLKALMADGLIFPDFKEAKITFKPTYKFDVGTTIYDTSAKKRIPSYCDRILGMCHDTTYGKRDHLKFKSCDYRAHFSFLVSDHKPVSCTLDFLGLSKPSMNPVTFNVSKVISKKVPMEVFYSSRGMDMTTSDWVAVYRSDFIDLMDGRVNYVYVTGLEARRPFNGFSVFPASTFVSLPKGSTLYVLYFSKKYSFSGISRAIKVKD